MMTHLFRNHVKSFALAAADSLVQREDVRRLVFNAFLRREPAMMQLSGRDDVRFLASILDKLSESKAQILQDLWVLFELDDKRGGFFVEFGATNGLVNSNTWLLETAYGWSGILAEPNPVWHADLTSNRRCAIDMRCVYAETGATLEFLSPDDPELSGLAQLAGDDCHSGRRAKGTSFQVATVSLNDLLRAHDAPKVIDYMSVDTEGSEYEILKSFAFSEYDVKLFSIEHNYTANQSKIDALMSSHGYSRRFPNLSQWDAWYVKNA